MVKFDSNKQTWVTHVYYPDCSSSIERPFFWSHVPGGFPDPTQEHIFDELDLNKLLIKRPNSTYFFRVAGNSMEGVGIFTNSILVVDKSIESKSGHIVVVILDGAMLVKRLRIILGNISLVAENQEAYTIHVTESMNFVVWGVVTATVFVFLKS